MEGVARGIGRMVTANLGTEILYSFVIIFCSIMIYFGTKELYELSKHKGIKYFRLTFLFFALAYFSRSFIKFVILYSNSAIISDLPRVFLNPFFSRLSLFLFIYLSTTAIIFLIYSILWKRISKFDWIIYLAQGLSVLFSLLIISTNSGVYYLILNLILFLIVLFSILSIIFFNKEKSFSKIYIIYILLSSFLILNTIDLLLPSFFQEIQILIYLFSSGLFLIMLYKVLKSMGK